MFSLFLQNTLTGKKEKFIPLQKNKASLYSCGPTVYDYAHIGNFRSFLFSDFLTRVLTYAGYHVTKVQNITDVGHLTQDDLADAEGEDKIAQKAKKEKKDPFQIAQYFEKAFIEDEKKLRILPPTHRPRATDYIAEQIQLTEKLLQEGFAYESNGSVYFETQKFETYGQLSKNNLADLVAGARVEVHSDKKNPLDFALWKKADQNHIMQWESPWGKGFPGWHIECSAMSQALLGDHFDIHTGGEDNIFPHHECEIAQNECSNHGKKSVNYWLHVKHLQLNGQKMSKSKNNFFTIRDLLEKGWKGEEIRYALLSGHYRTSLNFSEELLTQAKKSIERIREAYRVFQDFAQKSPADDFSDSFRKKYQESLADDLQISGALACVFDLIRSGMKHRDENTLTKEKAQSIVNFLEKDFDSLFDVLSASQTLDPVIIEAIEEIIKKRHQARADKNWALADTLRQEAETKYAVHLLDENGKTIWKIKN